MKVIVFSLLMMMPLASGGTSGFPLELMEPTDIRDIERLDYEVERLNANKLESAISVYQTVLKKHPDWENRAVLWWDSTRTTPSNLHLGGLKLTIEKPCQNLVGL